jgi:tungstate transport system substrate-binding protein
VSRGDESGTHLLEKQLWEQAGLTPAGPWYLVTGRGMGSALEVAGSKHAYVLTDRATYVAFRRRTGLVIAFERDLELLNPYHVLEVNLTKQPRRNPLGGKALADFLLSSTVQNLLRTFGAERFGELLFHPAGGRTEDALRQQILQ